MEASSRAARAGGRAMSGAGRSEGRSAGAHCAQLRCRCLPPGALMLDQMDAARLAALTPSSGRRSWPARRRTTLTAGCCWRPSGSISPPWRRRPVAEAHAGLAEVRERTGDAEAARKEAHAALELMPSADAYLVLGRLDFAAAIWTRQQRRLKLGEALKLDPATGGAGAARQIEAQKGRRSRLTLPEQA
jgi:hypothetical protein